MRILLPAIANMFAVIVIFMGPHSMADEPINPLIEFQSGPLTPALELDDVSRPIHQIRLVVDAKMTRGILILDSNMPEFDDFGDLVGGLQTPHVRGKGDPKLISELRCNIEFLREGSGKWRVYQLQSSKTVNGLRLATRGPLANGGPARILVLDSNDKISAVIPCTPYGLVVP